MPDIYFSNPTAKGPEAALARGETVAPLTIPVTGAQHVYGLACPEGGVIAAGLADGRLVTYDSATGACTRVLQGHSKRIYAVSAAGGGRIATASRDKDVRVWTASPGGVRSPARAEGAGPGAAAAGRGAGAGAGAAGAAGRGGKAGGRGSGNGNGNGAAGASAGAEAEEDLSKLHPLLGGTMKVKEEIAGPADGWKAFLGAAGTEPFGGPYGDGESAEEEDEESGGGEEEEDGSAPTRKGGRNNESGASLEELD